MCSHKARISLNPRAHTAWGAGAAARCTTRTDAPATLPFVSCPSRPFAVRRGADLYVCCYCGLMLLPALSVLGLMMSVSPSMAHKRVQEAGRGAWLIRSTSAIASNISNSHLFTITRLRSEGSEACSHRILHLEVRQASGMLCA